jgi:hypothetical protein
MGGDASDWADDAVDEGDWTESMQQYTVNPLAS